MCGITGIINSDDSSIIEKMTLRLAHRGPDFSKTIISDHVHLGHTRLAIQDLSSDANQPFVSDCGNYIIVFNGELYNHQEIRVQLRQENYKTTSDTETLVYAYKQYGLDCLELFNGIFAFCILDKANNKLVLARDRMGVKPLYYYKKENSFSFSSEIKSFLELPTFDKSINYQAIAYYIQYQYCPSNATPFLNVHKLERGTYLEYDLNDNKVNINAYSQFNFEEHEDDLVEATNKLTESLSQAVVDQHLSDVPIGYLLSGGVDSSAIMHYSKECNSELKAYTVDDEHNNHAEGFESDLPFAKLIADKYEVHLKAMKPLSNVAESLDKIIYHLDEPIGDTAVLSLYPLCQEASKDGLKVLLSGLGADDLFSGYRRHQALKFQNYKKLARIIPNEILPKHIRRRLEKFKGDIPDYYNWLSKENVQALFNNDIKQDLYAETPIESTWKNETGLGALNKMLNLEQKYYLPHNNLLYTDKIGMAFGVEIRVPFLDNSLVDFANHLPANFKLNDFSTKYILKESLKDKLPNKILNRKKTGFGFPIRSLIMNDDLGIVEKYLLTGNFFNRNIFDKKAILKLIEDNKTSKIDASHSIWTLICLESWFRQFVD